MQVKNRGYFLINSQIMNSKVFRIRISWMHILAKNMYVFFLELTFVQAIVKHGPAYLLEIKLDLSRFADKFLVFTRCSDHGGSVSWIQPKDVTRGAICGGKPMRIPACNFQPLVGTQTPHIHKLCELM